MKTTISVQKTENRNFKTSNMKNFVLLTGVAMFGFMAGAYATVEKGMAAEGNKHFLAPVSVINLASTAELTYSTEKMLEVESWMINETYFVSPIPAAEAEALMEVIPEEMLEVENWMTNESYFVSPLPVAESEELLSVEDWMLSDQNFSGISMEEEKENTLEVEDWMLNECLWGN